VFTFRSSHGAALSEAITLPVKDVAAWQEAEASGIDVSLLFESSQMTPDERIRSHSSALALAVKLRAASSTLHGP